MILDTLQFFNENPYFFIIVVGIVSLFIGSFLNVVIYRLPLMMQQTWSEECRIYLGLKSHSEEKKVNLALPFSHCPNCKAAIRPQHNIPILSFLFLRGKCAHCKTAISLRYPVVEALTCFVSVYTAWKFGVSWQTLAALVFIWINITLTFIDLDHHILPDQLTLLLLWVGLFISLFNIFVDSHTAILGAITGYLVFAFIQLLFGWITGKTGLGQGDYKFLAALGAWLGWHKLPLVILLSSIVGLIFALTDMFVKRQFKSMPLPFGPWLAAAGWIALLWGNEITRAYLSLI